MCNQSHRYWRDSAYEDFILTPKAGLTNNMYAALVGMATVRISELKGILSLKAKD